MSGLDGGFLPGHSTRLQSNRRLGSDLTYSLPLDPFNKPRMSRSHGVVPDPGNITLAKLHPSSKHESAL